MSSSGPPGDSRPRTGLCSFALATYAGAPIGRLLANVPFERRGLRDRGPVWSRHLGTARGQSSAPGADLRRWAWFSAWPPEASVEGILAVGGGRGSPRRAHPSEAMTIVLRPVRARGTWSGDTLGPFVPIGGEQPEPRVAPIAVLTRARVRVRRWRAFTAASPDVDGAMLRAPGRLLSVGIGEWPVGVQGTFSVWRDAAAIRSFAAATPEHLAVVRRTAEESWYAEEMFARFEVVAAAGRCGGRDIGDMLGGHPGFDERT